MKSSRIHRSSRTRHLSPLQWIIACLLLSMQALANSAGGCCPMGAGTALAGSMPGMTTADMQMSMPSADSLTCEHCKPNAHVPSCAAMHGCGAQATPTFILGLVAGIGDPRTVRIPLSVPGLSCLAFDPPLRPPAA